MATPASIVEHLSGYLVTAQVVIDEADHLNFHDVPIEYTEYHMRALATQLGEQIRKYYPEIGEKVSITNKSDLLQMRAYVFPTADLLAVIKSAYVAGRVQGIEDYSWMKDGTTYVGTTGKTLKQAVKDAEEEGR